MLDNLNAVSALQIALALETIFVFCFLLLSTYVVLLEKAHPHNNSKIGFGEFEKFVL
jgi:hypothetical protein